jgi:hypothetical protein
MRIQALVVIVYRNGKDFLGPYLADHVLIENIVDLVRLGKLLSTRGGFFLHLFPYDVVAKLDALVADEDRRTGNQFADFMLAFATERAIEQFPVFALAAALIGHLKPSSLSAKYLP